MPICSQTQANLWGLGHVCDMNIALAGENTVSFKRNR